MSIVLSIDNQRFLIKPKDRSTIGRMAMASSRWICASIVLACALPPNTVFAQEISVVELSGNIEAATDDRFRGYTRSAGEPVVRATLDAVVQIGSKTTLFSGAAASVTDGNADYGAFQTQIYAGVEQEVGASRLDG